MTLKEQFFILLENLCKIRFDRKNDIETRFFKIFGNEIIHMGIHYRFEVLPDNNLIFKDENNKIIKLQEIFRKFMFIYKITNQDIVIVQKYLFTEV